MGQPRHRVTMQHVYIRFCTHLHKTSIVSTLNIPLRGPPCTHSLWACINPPPEELMSGFPRVKFAGPTKHHVLDASVWLLIPVAYLLNFFTDSGKLPFSNPICFPINMLSEGLKLAIERSFTPETYAANPHTFELPVSQWEDWLQLRSRNINWRLKTKYDSSMSSVPWFTSHSLQLSNSRLQQA